jgi:hypothetical protein
LIRTLAVNLLAAAAAALGGCSTLQVPARAPQIATVNPASIAANPTGWDGKPVETVGLLVWEAENRGLYQSYGAFCRGGPGSAIYVQWENWPGVTRADSRRMVSVRGTFRNVQGNPIQPSGAVLVSNAAPGPGPLEPGGPVRFLGAPRKACPQARP